MPVQLVCEAQIHYFNSNYAKVITTLDGADLSRPKVLMMLGASYFFLGDFENSFKIYTRLFNKINISIYELGGVDVEDYV